MPYSLKKIFVVFLALAFLGTGIYQAARAWDKRADGFTLEKITSILTPEEKWNVNVSPEELCRINNILDQPYHYLGRGFQCYAFVSSDRKHVLKFFRHQRLRPSEVLDWLPQISWVKARKERKRGELEKRKEHLFKSFKIAFEYIPYETGLVYIHLNKTKELHKTITIVDKSGNSYAIPLDDYEFVLQRKASLLKPTITELMKQSKEEEAKKRINQIFTLLESCAKKGVLDTDGALIRKDNLGFLDDRAIYIDAGKLTLKEKIKRKEAFAKDLKRLRPFEKWLEENFPTLALYFDRQKTIAIKEF